MATIVRQQPLTAMLLEIASADTRLGASMVIRPPLDLRSSASIVPICSMIPVNKVYPISFARAARFSI